MSAFPNGDPVDLVVEALIGSKVVDLTGDVYQRDGITINRGRQNEQATTSRSSCTLTLDNRTGQYSSRNPVGQYYGQLVRNTQLTLAVRIGKDSFGRTVSNGWGTADVGGAYSLVGVGGTVANSDWAVAAGKATHSVPAVTGYRASYLATLLYRDVDVRVDVSLPFTDVTGGPLEIANVIVRGVSTSDYYMARVTVETDESIKIGLMHADGTVMATAVTVPGLTHSSSQTIRVRVLLEDKSLYAKVWAAALSEPSGWRVAAFVPPVGSPIIGWVGVRSGVSSANTNTLPIVFSYDNFEVRSPRFAGEVATWPAMWDPTTRDAYIQLEAAGQLQRLSQGDTPQLSTLRAGILSDPTTVEYWPCEDKEDSKYVASAMPGGIPSLSEYAMQFAAYSDLASSGPLPKMNLSGFRCDVRPYTGGVGTIQIRWVMVAAPTDADRSIIFRLRCSGTAPIWEINYGTGGSLRLIAYTADFGSLIFDGGAMAFNVDNKKLRCSLQLTQSGSDVNWQVSTYEYGTGAAGYVGGTVTGYSVGQATQVQMNVLYQLKDTVLGHVVVQNAVTDIFALASQFNAYLGEDAVDRIHGLFNLASPSGFNFYGMAGDSALMGPRSQSTIISMIQEAADADMGALYEPRGSLGITYRTRTSMYSQTPVVVASFAAGELAPPFAPTDDDQLTRNDVTVTRKDGSSARATKATGPLSTSPTSLGGVGVYSTSPTVNCYKDSQLPDIAGWQLALGTVDQPRYPALAFNLGSREVAANSALSAGLKILDIGDKITITNATAIGVYDTINQICIGLTEKLNAFEWTITANCVPGDPYEVADYDDSTYRYDSATSTLHAGITSTATSMQVDVADSVLWTTSAGDFPFDIMVSGERMTVTNITGSSSPQTWTVTRSVNGVVKAQSALAQVSLFFPPLYAL